MGFFSMIGPLPLAFTILMPIGGYSVFTYLSLSICFLVMEGREVVFVNMFILYLSIILYLTWWMLRDLVMVLDLILFYRNAQGTKAQAIGGLPKEKGGQCGGATKCSRAC